MKPPRRSDERTPIPDTMNADTSLAKYRHVIIHDNISPDGGGIQNMAFHLAVQLRRKGLKVVVAGKIRESVFKDSGIEVFGLEKTIRSKNTSDLRLLVLFLRLRLKYGRDVLLYSLLINNITVFRWMRPFLGWKCVAFLHGNEILRLSRRRKNTLSRNILACQCVFANSRFTGDYVGKINSHPNVTVVNPGISPRLFTEYGGPDFREKENLGDRKIILMLSRLSRRKGHETVIRALARLVAKHPDILLLIAGKGAYRPVIEKMVQDFRLTEHVGFLGRVGEKEKLSLYRACDVYCMPSEMLPEEFEVEGFGITFLEAAAMGKIAIGSNTGGIPDAIEDGRSGFLIEPGDDRRLEELLDDILSNPARYDRMRDYARERALRDFSWEKQGDRIFHLVEASLPEFDRQRTDPE